MTLWLWAAEQAGNCIVCEGKQMRERFFIFWKIEYNCGTQVLHFLLKTYTKTFCLHFALNIKLTLCSGIGKYVWENKLLYEIYLLYLKLMSLAHVKEHAYPRRIRRNTPVVKQFRIYTRIIQKIDRPQETDLRFIFRRLFSRTVWNFNKIAI